LRIKEENRFVGQSNNIFLQMVRDFVEVCPKCKCIKISVRRRTTPKYKCQNCKNEFDDPKADIVHKTIKQQREFDRQYSNPDY
jgi:ribosomal protein L37AE/L43A